MAQKIDTKNNLSPRRRFKLSLLSGFLFVIILGAMLWSGQYKPSPSHLVPTPTLEQSSADTLRYAGEEGVDALSLLKKAAPVEQDRSGLVVSINGRKADNSKKEYWSFFINGQMAQVGPAEYQTTDKDFIEWRIETY